MDKKLRLGIAGLGTVGLGVVNILKDQATELYEKLGIRLEIAGVSARVQRDRGVDLADVPFFQDPVALAKAKILTFLSSLWAAQKVQHWTLFQLL